MIPDPNDSKNDLYFNLLHMSAMNYTDEESMNDPIDISLDWLLDLEIISLEHQQQQKQPVF